jgi:hypothetical protein
VIVMPACCREAADGRFSGVIPTVRQDMGRGHCIISVRQGHLLSSIDEACLQVKLASFKVVSRLGSDPRRARLPVGEPRHRLLTIPSQLEGFHSASLRRRKCNYRLTSVQIIIVGTNLKMENTCEIHTKIRNELRSRMKRPRGVPSSKSRGRQHSDGHAVATQKFSPTSTNLWRKVSQEKSNLRRLCVVMFGRAAEAPNAP